MAVDHRRINSFISARQIRENVAKVVRGAGFKITWVVDNTDPRLWGMYLKPNKTLQQLFGTAREVLLWAAEFVDFQARTIQQAQEIIERERPRLSDEYCIVLVPDTNADEKMTEVSSDFLCEFVAFPVKEVSSFKPIGTLSFQSYLQGKLFARDLYRVSTPLTHASGFYGRKSLIGEVTTLLGRGISNVGVFGLRKMGKTSLLYRVLENLRSTGRVFACHVDLQRLDALNPSVGYALWSVGEALVDSNAKLRRMPGLRLFGRSRLYSDVDKNSVLELFDHDIRYILSESGQGVVFLLDEIELMSPIVPQARWGDSFVVFWRLLRGLHQQYPGKLSYLITGTNPKCIEMNKLAGLENPIYNYFDVKYLPALEFSEAHDLLSSIGGRMGLTWTRNSAHLVFRLVGGHPFLLRGLASVIHRKLLPRKSSVLLSEKEVFDALPRFLIEFNPNLSQMVEVLRDYYPDEFYLLETLASGRVGEFRQLAEGFPEDVAHLHGYGLLGFDLNEPRMSVEVLQTWLQRRQKTEERVREDPSRNKLEKGDRIEHYEILSAIGHKGGFAQVYRARGVGEQQDVAIKVFNSGLLTNLQREMDTLQAVSHPNVVKFIEHGRTNEGWLYVVMEYLPGVSLRSRVDRASRLSPPEVRRILACLASALVSLHPNEAIIEKMRMKNELGAGELEELENARHGFVHRDIKPENILLVDGRGPVLIDFNISCEVGTPVRTLKHTPGYIPPEGFPSQWVPAIDLYALGVTMLQAAVGIEFDGSNLDDLKRVARGDSLRPLYDIISRMCHGERDHRFRTAQEILEAVEGVKL